MKHGPIGILDSGLGGLTALRSLRSLLPEEDVVFLGDTARLPYGGRSQAQLRQFGQQGVDFLLRQGVKAVLIACGTLSANLEPAFFGRFSVPVWGVIEPTVCAAARQSAGRIGVIATEASIRAGAYQRALRAQRPDGRVTAVACPSFVPLIESGRTEPRDPAVREAVSRELAPFVRQPVDTLILGCTHFPLLREAIADFLPETALIDAGDAAAHDCALQLAQRGLLNPSGAGKNTFFVTGDKAAFAKNGGAFLGESLKEVLSAALPSESGDNA